MPLYSYRCEKCGSEVDRIVAIGDREVPCYCGVQNGESLCMGRMNYFFNPGRVSVVCYGPTHPLQEHGGPSAYSRHLKSKGQTAIGDASMDELDRHFRQKEREAEARDSAIAEKAAEECVQELGDALYTSEPASTEPKPLPDKVQQHLNGTLFPRGTDGVL